MENIGTFVLEHWFLFLGFFAALAMLIASFFKERLLGFREIKPAEAVEMINHQDAVVVDVREPEEFAAGHILNAINVPLAALVDRAGELEPYRARPLIVYCRSGSRAARASSLLRRLDFPSLTKLSGGMMAWERAGLPVSKPRE